MYTCQTRRYVERVLIKLHQARRKLWFQHRQQLSWMFLGLFNRESAEVNEYCKATLFCVIFIHVRPYLVTEICIALYQSCIINTLLRPRPLQATRRHRLYIQMQLRTLITFFSTSDRRGGDGSASLFPSIGTLADSTALSNMVTQSANAAILVKHIRGRLVLL